LMLELIRARMSMRSPGRGAEFEIKV